MYFLEQKRFRKVPEYYPQMYLDGFTREEIMYAFRRKIINDYNKRQEDEISNVKIESEIHVK